MLQASCAKGRCHKGHSDRKFGSVVGRMVSTFIGTYKAIGHVGVLEDLPSNISPILNELGLDSNPFLRCLLVTLFRESQTFIQIKSSRRGEDCWGLPSSSVLGVSFTTIGASQNSWNTLSSRKEHYPNTDSGLMSWDCPGCGGDSHSEANAAAGTER